MVKNAFTVILLSLLLAACQTNSDLGGEFAEVHEGDSAIVFYGQGLAGGFRHIITGYDIKTETEETTSRYSAKDGKSPYATIYHSRLKKSWHYFRKVNINTIAKMTFASGEFANPEILEKGKSENILGDIEYLVFQSDKDQCLLFYQLYTQTPFSGSNYDSLLVGTYCLRGKDTIANNNPELILKKLGDKQVSAPSKPVGWDEEIVHQDELVTDNRLFLNIQWDDNIVASDIVATITKQENEEEYLAIPFNFKTDEMGACTGKLNVRLTPISNDGFLEGKWLIDCANDSATGFFEISDEEAIDFVENSSWKDVLKLDAVPYGFGNGTSINKQEVSLTVFTKSEEYINRLHSIAAKEIEALAKLQNLKSEIRFIWNTIGSTGHIPIQFKEGLGHFSFEHNKFGSCNGHIKIVGTATPNPVGRWEVRCTDDISAKGQVIFYSAQQKFNRENAPTIAAKGEGKDNKQKTVTAVLYLPDKWQSKAKAKKEDNLQSDYLVLSMYLRWNGAGNADGIKFLLDEKSGKFYFSHASLGYCTGIAHTKKTDKTTSVGDWEINCNRGDTAIVKFKFSKPLAGSLDAYTGRFVAGGNGLDTKGKNVFINLYAI